MGDRGKPLEPADAGFTLRTLRGPEVDPELAWRLHAATAERYQHGPRPLPRSYFEAQVTAFSREVEFVEARNDSIHELEIAFQQVPVDKTAFACERCDAQLTRR
jgi:hypothetical protein